MLIADIIKFLIGTVRHNHLRKIKILVKGAGDVAQW
jgi:hypothetical protein